MTRPRIWWQAAVTAAVTAAVIAAAGGCVSDTAEQPGHLELGTGSWRYEPLEDGQQVELIRGAQGGWHLWVSLRARGIERDLPVMDLVVEPADEGAPPQRTEVPVRFDPPDDEGRRAMIGWPAILADPSCQVGELLRLEARVTDDAGHELVAERYVVPMGGAYPPPPCD